MNSATRIVSAVAFAVLWTAYMLWWSYPAQGVAHTVIFVAAGAIGGLVWYWLFGWLFAKLWRPGH